MDLDSKELAIVRTHASSMRNSIVIISLGIVMYGISQALQNTHKITLEIVSVLIYYISISLLYTNNQMFTHFVNNLKDKSQETNSYLHRYMLISWTLLFLFSVFIIIGTYRTIRNISKFTS